MGFIFIILIKMKKRGPVIGIIGLMLVVGSLSVMFSVFPASNITNRDDSSIPSMFEGMFSQVSDNIQITPGESGYFSYSTKSSDVPLLWGVQIIDYHDGDNLSISISNIYGDNYGVFPQDGPIIFETLEITKSDTLNFEIQNHGSRIINVVVMLSEDPDNSGALSSPNSPFMNKILPLAISGILIILGIITLLIGVIISLVDWKNIQNNKRNF
ncbi:hypothetical protein LBMAG54_05980 [Nitrosopumilaceae archaeon]|nr:hypothetical protein EMGBD3_12810 [Nitrosarchaeum sp.]GDY15742.1 hypothetical protein LBMAG54_05980 [Nitrosopumilaceae archaeon]